MVPIVGRVEIVVPIVLFVVLAWIVYRNAHRPQAEVRSDKSDQEPFGTDFRWAVGLPAMLAAIILLVWSWDLEPWTRLIPLFLLILAGACLLPRVIAIWFRWTLFISTIILVSWGLIAISTQHDAVALLIGTILGGSAGVAGGFLGGYLSEFFSPMARLASRGFVDRLKGARRSNEYSSRTVGIVAGLVAGAIVGLLGHHANLFQIIAIAVLLFTGVSEWLESSAGETIVGFPGTLIGGGIFGAFGGYVGRYVADLIL